MRGPLRLLLLLPAIGGSFLLYYPSIDGQFVFDDVPILVEGRCHRQSGALVDMFLPSTTNICARRPVRSASYALEYIAWGGGVRGHHIVNIVLHGLFSWLAFAWLLARGFTLRLALLSGLIVLCHPVSSEAVANIAGRRDLLMGLFVLITVWLHQSFVQRGGLWRFGLMLLAYYGALGSHGIAVAVAPAVAAWEFGCVLADRGEARPGALSDWATRRRLVSLGVLLAIALAYTTVTVSRFSDSMSATVWGGSVATHVATMARIQLHYLHQLVLPIHLMADYAPENFLIVSQAVSTKAILSLSLVSALGAALLFCWSRAPRIAGAVTAYLCLMVPVSQLYPHRELFAEHRLYLPTLIYAALVASGLIALTRCLRRPMLSVVMAGVLCVLFGIRTHARAEIWQTARGLWEDSLASSPRSARALANVGALEAQRRKYARAEKLLRRALEIDPTQCTTQANLARLLRDTNRLSAAEATAAGAVKCDPSPSRWRLWGEVQLKLRQPRRALKSLRISYQLRPASGTVVLLGRALRATGEAAQAQRLLAKAVKQFRTSAAVHRAWLAVIVQRCDRKALADALIICEARKLGALVPVARRSFRGRCGATAP